MELLEDALRTESDDLELHQHYIHARGRGMVEGGVLLAEYRAWHEQAPKDEVRRVALAMALTFLHPEPCDPVTAVLERLPRAPELLRTVDWIARKLERKDASCAFALPARARDRIPSRPTSWPRQLDADAAASMKAFWKQHPRRIDRAQWLWRGVNADEPYYSGPALEQARADALEAMRSLATGSDIPTLWSLRMIGSHPDLEEISSTAARSLAALEEPPVDGELEQQLYDAQNHLDAKVALERLNSLEDRIPARGELCSKLEAGRYLALGTLGRQQEAVEAAERAWRCDPEHPGIAEWFARVASGHQAAHAVGYEAARAALAAERASRFEPDWYFSRYEGEAEDWVGQHVDWTRDHRDRMRELTSMVRWYEAQLGKPVRPAYVHEPLDAAVFWDVGQGDDSRLGEQHLVRAAVLDASRRPAVVAELERRDAWFLAGAEAHIDAWKQRGSVADRPAITSHILAPEPFDPTYTSAPFLVDGEERTLDSYAGLRVVYLWKTWCPPCVPDLRMLDAIASDFDGRITVIAIATDEDWSPVEAALERAEHTAVMGWSPTAFRDLVVGQVPRLFVLDANGDALDGASRDGPTLRALLERVLDGTGRQK